MPDDVDEATGEDEAVTCEYDYVPHPPEVCRSDHQPERLEYVRQLEAEVKAATESARYWRQEAERPDPDLDARFYSTEHLARVIDYLGARATPRSTEDGIAEDVEDCIKWARGVIWEATDPVSGGLDS